jgi:hypothetical protein
MHTASASARTSKAGANCLRASELKKHTDLVVGACDANSKWQAGSTDGALQNVAATSIVVKTNGEASRGADVCKDGVEVWLGKLSSNHFFFDATTFNGSVLNAANISFLGSPPPSLFRLNLHLILHFIFTTQDHPTC